MFSVEPILVPSSDPPFLLHGGLAVIGHPVGHTLSPVIHNAALAALGHPPVYEALDVPPERLQATIGRLAENYAGVNVTIPHKQSVLPLMDRLSERARAVGAVNTITVDRTGAKPELVGDNTDVAGFLQPLDLFDLQGCEVVVVGAGGAARAVVFGVLSALRPARLSLLARRTDRAEALLHDLGAVSPGTRTEVGTVATSGDTLSGARLVVNTTPVGMSPHQDETPCPDPSVFSAGQIVYDLVYRPSQTRFLRDARGRGATTIGGLPMLVGQAAVAFEAWTGVPMPLDAVHSALARHLS